MTLYEEILAKCSTEQIAAGNYHDMAATVSVGRVSRSELRVTEQTIADKIDFLEGEAFLVALEGFGVNDLAVSHPLKAYQPGMRRQLAYLKTNGINMASPTARTLIDMLASAGLIDAGTAVKVKELAPGTPNPVGWEQCQAAIEKGA